MGPPASCVAQVVSVVRQAEAVFSPEQGSELDSCPGTAGETALKPVKLFDFCLHSS